MGGGGTMQYSFNITGWGKKRSPLTNFIDYRKICHYTLLIDQTGSDMGLDVEKRLTKYHKSENGLENTMKPHHNDKIRT